MPPSLSCRTSSRARGLRPGGGRRRRSSHDVQGKNVQFSCHLWCRTKYLCPSSLTLPPPPPSICFTAAVRAGRGRDPEPDVRDVYNVRVPAVEGWLLMGYSLKVRFQTIVLFAFLCWLSFLLQHNPLSGYRRASVAAPWTWGTGRSRRQHSRVRGRSLQHEGRRRCGVPPHRTTFLLRGGLCNL